MRNENAEMRNMRQGYAVSVLCCVVREVLCLSTERDGHNHEKDN